MLISWVIGLKQIGHSVAPQRSDATQNGQYKISPQIRLSLVRTVHLFLRNFSMVALWCLTSFGDAHIKISYKYSIYYLFPRFAFHQFVATVGRSNIPTVAETEAVLNGFRFNTQVAKTCSGDRRLMATAVLPT